MDVLDFRIGPLRAYLSKEAYREACERAQRVTFGNGQSLHSRGDVSPRLCIVASGAVRLGRYRPDGSFNLVSMIGVGGHFGDIAIQREVYTHDGYAVGESEIYVVGSTALDHLLRNQPGFALGLWRCNTARLNALLELYDDARTLSVAARLAKVVYLHAGRGALANGVSCRQRDLAELLGVSDVSIGNALKDLEKDDLVQIRYRCIMVPNKGRLKDWLKKSGAV